jgi:hypothetical protein
MLRAALLITIAALAVAACGSHPDDPALARRSVLTLKDLPPGWTATGTIGRRHSSCPALVLTRRAATAVADSAAFQSAQQAQTMTSVGLYSDTAAAKRAFARASAGATSCYTSELIAAADRTPGVQAGPSYLTRLEIGSVGDQRAGSHIGVPITDGGRHSVLDVDLVFVRTGRAVSLGIFAAQDSSFPNVLRAQLTIRQSERLAAELG